MSDDDIQYQYEYDNVEDQHKKNGAQESTKEDIGVADETAGAGERWGGEERGVWGVCGEWRRGGGVGGERGVRVEGERGVCVEGGRGVWGGVGGERCGGGREEN